MTQATMHCHRASTSPKQGREHRVDTDRRQCGLQTDAGRRSFLVEVAMTGQDLALELFLVGVPKLRCLSVERARTGFEVVSIDWSIYGWVQEL